MKTKLIFLALAFASCAPIYKTGQRVDYARPGDTKQTVQAIYGQPCSVATTLSRDKWIDTWLYCSTFVNGGIDTTQSTTLVFIDNKLTEIR